MARTFLAWCFIDFLPLVGASQHQLLLSFHKLHHMRKRNITYLLHRILYAEVLAQECVHRSLLHRRSYTGVLTQKFLFRRSYKGVKCRWSTRIWKLLQNSYCYGSSKFPGGAAKTALQTWPSAKIVRVGRTNLWWNVNLVGDGVPFRTKWGVDLRCGDLRWVSTAQARTKPTL